MLFLLTILIGACNRSDTSLEKENGAVFPEDTMTMILQDIYLAESYIRQMERQGKDVSAYSNHVYQMLMEKYHTDSVKISNSILYYAANPEKMKQVSDKTLENLIIKETMLQKK